MTELMPERYRAQHSAGLARYVESGVGLVTGTTIDVAGLRADGSEFALEISIHALQGGADRPLLFAGLARDITERRRQQARMIVDDRLSSTSQLAGGVAHEINNPLASVVANLEYAKDGLRELAHALSLPADGDPPAARMIEEVEGALVDARNGAVRVRDIVRGLRSFASPEGDRRNLIDLRALVETTAQVASRPIRQRARLERDLGQAPLVLGNEARLAQALLSLMSNAAQAFPDGGGQEQVIRVSTSTDASGWAVIEVRDNGSGIPADLIHRIFDPFFTTRSIGLGSGLGLSVAHSIVTSLGGTIDAESQPGATRMLVRLPPAAQPAPAAGQPAPRSCRPGAGRAARLLVIDDEPAVGIAVRRVLGKRHDVTLVTSAREALLQLDRSEEFDLILCDVMMPEMTGMDLYEHLERAGSPLTSRFVFLTGGAFTREARGFLDRIANPRVDKPFEPAALSALIHELLELRADGHNP
jgi:signal transduction histidine kinase